MKKLLKLMLAIAMPLTMVGCSSTPEDEETANILCPSGAPSLSLVSIYDDVVDAGGSITFVDGSDTLVAELSKEDSEYDIIVAPINVGAKLIAADSTDYLLAGVLTWGNLYIVGTADADLSGEGEIALFGSGAVPEMIYNQTKDEIGITLTETYYDSATLVQEQLLAGNVEAGILAEPVATATIAKASQAGIELTVLADLQEYFNDGEGYPQASIFIKSDEYYNDLLDSLDEWTNNGYEDVENLIDSIGAETLGLPSTTVAVNSLDRQNISYVAASDCVDELTDFLALYEIEFSEDMIHD